jgi:hypothetical protein
MMECGARPMRSSDFTRSLGLRFLMDNSSWSVNSALHAGQERRLCSFRWLPRSKSSAHSRQKMCLLSDLVSGSRLAW